MPSDRQGGLCGPQPALRFVDSIPQYANVDIMEGMKPVIWVRDSLRRLRAFPGDVQEAKEISNGRKST
jgi:hypothetical protein